MRSFLRKATLCGLLMTGERRVGDRCLALRDAEEEVFGGGVRGHPDSGASGKFLRSECSEQWLQSLVDLPGPVIEENGQVVAEAAVRAEHR